MRILEAPIVNPSEPVRPFEFTAKRGVGSFGPILLN